MVICCWDHSARLKLSSVSLFTSLRLCPIGIFDVCGRLSVMRASVDFDGRTTRCLDPLCFAASCKVNPPFIIPRISGWPWSLAVPVAFLDVFSFLAGRGLQCYRQACQELLPSFIVVCKLSGTDIEVLTGRLRCSFSATSLLSFLHEFGDSWWTSRTHRSPLLTQGRVHFSSFHPRAGCTLSLARSTTLGGVSCQTGERAKYVLSRSPSALSSMHVSKLPECAMFYPGRPSDSRHLRPP